MTVLYFIKLNSFLSIEVFFFIQNMIHCYMFINHVFDKFLKSIFLEMKP